MEVTESIGSKSTDHHLNCNNTGRVIDIASARYSFSPNCSKLSSSGHCTEYFRQCCRNLTNKCLIDFTGKDLNSLKELCSNKDYCSHDGFPIDKFPGCYSSPISQSIVYYRCIDVEGQVYGGSPVGVIVGCLFTVLIVIVIIAVTVAILRRFRKRRYHEDDTFVDSLYINKTGSSFLIDSIPPTVVEPSSDKTMTPYATSSVTTPDDKAENNVTDTTEIGDNHIETRPLRVGKVNRNSFFKPISTDSNPSDTSRKSQLMMEEVAVPEPEQHIRLLVSNTDGASSN